MKCSGQHLFTPLYLKLNEAMSWPDDESAFYLLSRDGLFLCRNTPFFRSCVPVENFPSELSGQDPFMKLSYPRIPRRLLEQVIGFFDLVGARYASEAGVLLAWNRKSRAVEVIVPEQVGIVGISWSGEPYPLELEYELPRLPSHLVLLGDIHSHVDGAAYASFKDKSDETHWPGLHLVVGHISDEPPQFHCEATVDGFRFKVRDLGMVLEGYHRRRVNEVPADWIDKLTVKLWSSKPRYTQSDRTSPNNQSNLTGTQRADDYNAPSRVDDLEAVALIPQDLAGVPESFPGGEPPSSRTPSVDDAPSICKDSVLENPPDPPSTP